MFKLFGNNVPESLSTIVHDTEIENLEPNVKLALEKINEKNEGRLLKMEEKINMCVCDIQKLLDKTKRF